MSGWLGVREIDTSCENKSVCVRVCVCEREKGRKRERSAEYVIFVDVRNC